MHDDCNYKKQAESDYKKFHSLRETTDHHRSLGCEQSQPAWPWPKIKGFCEALRVKYEKRAGPGLQANVPEGASICTEPVEPMSFTLKNVPRLTLFHCILFIAPESAPETRLATASAGFLLLQLTNLWCRGHLPRLRLLFLFSQLRVSFPFQTHPA